MTEIIKLENIYKTYPNKNNSINALDGISLSVKESEYLAVIGKSGSGKSTLMNILGCLDIPSAGNYILCGKNASSFADKELSHIRNNMISFVFQSFNLIPYLNALENVELPLIYRGYKRKEARKTAENALEKVGLNERFYHRPSQLSGGQQQRVAIARAIATKPPILLADEPTGNLDMQSSGEIMAIIDELRKDNMTVIIITHDIEVARKASRVIELKGGRIEGMYYN